MTALRVEKKRLSFNRYMVECELYPRTFAILRMKVLIDTWWNVNTSAIVSSSSSCAF